MHVTTYNSNKRKKIRVKIEKNDITSNFQK